jgi:flagellar protein FlgJ
MVIQAVNTMGASLGMADPALRREAQEGGALFERLLRRQSEAGGAAPPAAGNTAKVSVTTDDEKKLFEQCRALETFLMKILVGGMRKTVMKSELIDTGFAGQMYEDMLYDEYAKTFAEKAGFGLAETAYLELTGRRGERFSPRV